VPIVLIHMEKTLPAIPAKRYFTIGEVSELCGVKPYVLRYWEQEFTQLKPMKRRGNRRYYQHHEVLLIRRIRELLYDQGFTISGARSRLTGTAAGRASGATAGSDEATGSTVDNAPGGAVQGASEHAALERGADACTFDLDKFSVAAMRQELLLIRELLSA
jgi:DNA-binding transcriptional MerR regulator